MNASKEIILIIEDDLGLAELINERIQQAGFETFTVFSARQALEEKMNDMLNFHRLTVGRELTMIELKKEVNELHKELGLESKYHIVK